MAKRKHAISPGLSERPFALASPLRERRQESSQTDRAARNQGLGSPYATSPQGRAKNSDSFPRPSCWRSAAIGARPPRAKWADPAKHFSRPPPARYNACMDRASRLAAGSVAVAASVLALKLGAWWLTGSVALFADALESIVNVAAAAAALFAVRLSAMPADANHPYGHAKAEYFSAVLEGALILVAALMILNEVWGAFMSPRAPDAPALGLAISAFATGVNAFWALRLARGGRALASPALLADARHLWADVVTSAGVIAGVALVALTGLLWLDPLLAALTAVNILWSGSRLLRESLGGLMDEAVPPALLARIQELVRQEGAGAIEAHDLRTRHAGRFTFVEFHLVVPGEMRVRAAHEICDRIEAALKAELTDAVITIHVEPEAKAKREGVQLA
jgi:cation diffusion facilitator family transporter